MLWQSSTDSDEQLQRLFGQSSLEDAKLLRSDMAMDMVPEPVQIRVTPPRSPTPTEDHPTAVPQVATYQPTGLPPRIPPKNRRRMESRDARVEDNTTGHLAAYIRALPAQGNALQPKEAKVRSVRHVS